MDWLGILRSLVLLLLMLASCERDFTPAPGQEHALSIVWGTLYQEFRYDPPGLEWEHQNHLTCASDGTRFLGFAPGAWTEFQTHDDDCVSGVYWLPPNDFAQVALPDGRFLHETAMSHELWHAFLLYETGDANGSHSDPGFQPGGIVDQANQALAEVGL